MAGDPMTWNDAQKACNLESPSPSTWRFNLASVHSYPEAAFLNILTGDHDNKYFIGAEMREFVWYWSDYTTFTLSTGLKTSTIYIM